MPDDVVDHGVAARAHLVGPELAHAQRRLPVLLRPRRRAHAHLHQPSAPPQQLVRVIRPGGEAEAHAQTLGQKVGVRVDVNNRPPLADPHMRTDRGDDRPRDRVVAAQHEDAQSRRCAPAAARRSRAPRSTAAPPARSCRRRSPDRGTVGARPPPLLIAQHVVLEQLRHREHVAHIDDPRARRPRREIGARRQQRAPHALGPERRAPHQAGARVGRDADDRRARRPTPASAASHFRCTSSPSGASYSRRCRASCSALPVLTVKMPPRPAARTGSGRPCSDPETTDVDS